MSITFRYFLRVLSTICRMALDCLRYCWQAISSCFSARLQGKSLPEASDNTENGHLVAHSTSAMAAFQTQLCRRSLDSFSQIYLRSTRQSLNWDISNTVNSKTVVICAKISRLQDDIQATLNRLNIKGQSKIMLIVIHACEPGVTPENLLSYRPDDRVTSFTNVLYSETTTACYECPTNRKAAADIKRFIK